MRTIDLPASQSLLKRLADGINDLVTDVQPCAPQLLHCREPHLPGEGAIIFLHLR